jgi:hypothetical protein
MEGHANKSTGSAPDAVDAVLLAAIGSFVLAVAYSTTVSFVFTKGASPGASPWYMQVLLLPVISIVMKGASVGGRVARMIGSSTVLLWAYVMVASYLAKLLPQYGGYDSGRIHFADLLTWYLQNGSQRNEILNTTTLASSGVLYGLVTVVTFLAGLIAAMISPVLYKPNYLVPPTTDPNKIMSRSPQKCRRWRRSRRFMALW